MNPAKPQARAGLTLIEVMVVIAILLTAMSLLLVALQSTRESANRIRCQARLKDLVLAVHLHHDKKGTMPPYTSGKSSNEIIGGWFLHLLPYIGYEALYEEIKSAQYTSAGGDEQLITAGVAFARGVVFPELTCPTDNAPPSKRDPLTNYLANCYALSEDKIQVYSPAQPFRNLWDGPSNVVLFAEGHRQCAGVPRLALTAYPYHNFGITQDGKASDDPSYAPNDYTMFQIKPTACDKWRAQTAHSSMPVGIADGSSKFLSASLPADVWTKLLKPRDGSPAGDW